MACLEFPAVTAPTLPEPLSLTLPSVSVSFDLELCCKLPPIPLQIPPIPLPPIILNSAVIAALNAFIQQAITYINLLPLECPLE